MQSGARDVEGIPRLEGGIIELTQRTVGRPSGNALFVHTSGAIPPCEYPDMIFHVGGGTREL